MISQDRNSLKSRGRYWDATDFDDSPRTATPLDRKMFKQDNPATEILDRKLITNKSRASSEHHDGNDRLAVREGLKLGLQVGTVGGAGSGSNLIGLFCFHARFIHRRWR